MERGIGHGVYLVRFFAIGCASLGLGEALILLEDRRAGANGAMRPVTRVDHESTSMGGQSTYGTKKIEHETAQMAGCRWYCGKACEVSLHTCGSRRNKPDRKEGTTIKGTAGVEKMGMSEKKLL